MSSLDHIVLFLFLFLFIPLWGKYNCHKKGNRYWISAIFPILLIAIITGCRYWGADYLWYKYQFEHLNNIEVIEEQSSQPIFFGLNHLLNWLGFNYIGVFITYSLIYFIGAFQLLKTYGKESQYMYYFLIFAYIGFGTSIIRQGISIGIVMFSISFLDQKKYIKFGLWVICACMIHSATILLVVTIVFFQRFATITIKPIYPILFYLIIAFVYNPANMGFIANTIQMLSFINSKFQGYIDNSAIWFSEDAAQDKFTQSSLAIVLNSLFIVSIFYLGHLALKIRYNKRIAYMYNIVVVGYILLRMFFNFELLRRIATPMTMFYPIPLGYALYVLLPLLKEKLITATIKKKIIFSISLIFLYLALYWGRFLLQSPQYHFVWNINQ